MKILRGPGRTFALPPVLTLVIVTLVVVTLGGASVRAETHSSPSRYAALWNADGASSETELLALARDEDPVTRQFAMLELGELEDPSDAAVDALIAALGDGSGAVRLQALAVLMRLGEKATAQLTAALSDLEELHQLSYDSDAFNGRRRVGFSRSDLAFTALWYGRSVDLDRLLAAYGEVPGAAAEEPEAVEPFENLGDLNAVVSQLLDQVTSGRGVLESKRERILAILHYVPAQRTPGLSRALVGEDRPLREAAARLAGRLGAEAAPLVPLLSEAALDEDPESSLAAAYALAETGESGEQVLRGFFGLADNPHGRRAGAAALPQEAAGAAEALSGALKDPDPRVSRAALGRLRDPGRAARLGYWAHRHADPCQLAAKGKPAEKLLAELPPSAFDVVQTLTRHDDPGVRAAAVTALASLGCALPERAVSAAEGLAEIAGDSAVAAEAAAGLSALAKFGFLPRSDQAAGQLLSALRSSNGSGNESWIEVLTQMDLSEERSEELFEALLSVCLQDSSGFFTARRILESRPLWKEQAIQRLRRLLREPQGPGRRAYGLLRNLAGEKGIETPLLEVLLDHPDKEVRLEAADELVERGLRTPRVLSVLEEEARSAERFGAPSALYDAGEPGIEKIRDIVFDPRTSAEKRESLVSHFLSRAAGKSTVAAEALLALANSPASVGLPEPTQRVQRLAVEALGGVSGHDQAVHRTLETALHASDPELREAAISAWTERDLSPQPLLDLAATDPSPRVRLVIAENLKGPVLPDDTRMAILRSALSAEDEDLVRGALARVAGLGEAGEKLLAEYLEHGGGLSDAFLRAVHELLPIGEPLRVSLEQRLETLDEDERFTWSQMLGKRDEAKTVEELYFDLASPQAAMREQAAFRLFHLGQDPWAGNGLLAVVLQESQVFAFVRKCLGEALDLLYPPKMQLLSGRGKTLPVFPWPPPPGYRPPIALPRNIVAPAASPTLGDVYQTLVGALAAASDGGFEQGLFELQQQPQGFALVARMECVRADGTPLPGLARWIKKGASTLGFWEFLGDLFFERPGYFRTLVFVVTSDISPAKNPWSFLPEPAEGKPTMPAWKAAEPLLDDQEILAFVYTFERRRGAKVIPWEDGVPSARQHLEKAGVWPALMAGLPSHR